MSTTTKKCQCCPNTNTESSDTIFIVDHASGLVLCSDCVLCFSKSLEYIAEKEEIQEIEDIPLPLPKHIYEALDRHVVRQEESKKTISIAVAHHYRRLKDPSIGKSNILIVGPTGTGKTELGRAVANYLQVPFVVIDATTITAKGYMGEDADSCIKRLVVSAGFDKDKAEKGIIFIDEIDKIAKRDSSDNNSTTTAVQQQLLKIMEGSQISVKIPNEKGGDSTIVIDTSKILFICSGAFPDLEKISSEKGMNSIGIAAKIEPIAETTKIKSKHLLEYGLIPEFLGRLPVITTTHPLSIDDLIQILTEPQNSLTNQYKKLFLQDQVKVIFSKDLIKEIAQQAYEQKTGARGLRSIFEEKIKNLYFNIDHFLGKTVNIHKNELIKIENEDSNTKIAA